MRLFKRDGIWYIEFRRNVKKSLRTGNEREARRLFRLAKEEYLKGRLVQLDDRDRVTLQEFFDRFLVSKVGLAEKTLRHYNLSVRLLAEVIGWSTPIKLIGKEKLTDFKSVCLKRGVRPVSINSYLRHIRAVLNAAYEEGIIERRVKVDFLKVGHRLPKTFTSEELRLIQDYAHRHDFEMWRVIRFDLYTGCRRSEIVGLQWSDVGKDTFRIIGKGDKERNVPLVKEARKAMGQPKDIGPVFLQVHPDTYTHRFREICKGCGVEGRSFHSLRHSAATAMLESGMALEVIQKILGHADLATTQIYAEVRDRLVLEEIRKLKF